MLYLLHTGTTLQTGHPGNPGSNPGSVIHKVVSYLFEKKFMEVLPNRLILTPARAREMLISTGFEENTWDLRLGKDKDGIPWAPHEVRALIIIARSNEPMCFDEVIINLKRQDGPELLGYEIIG